ncbi:RelA/SpoT domain-containing protein [Pontibacter liquoris]|uniref:RelA/SpoT domain-containing protein n=1 Tax=Pontibacter liquoris TaxID=2905677 RepID=UPI001FA75CFA|nr:RelA/SpoT domain-containing protein [Pontibacter liquoris]
MPQHHDTETATLPFILALLGTTEQALQEQQVAPQALVAIYNDYRKRLPELTSIAELVAATLMKAADAHAVRYRIKDPLHLLRKIIRKKKEYPDRIIDQDNYIQWINDLVGVRVLHLYREAWVPLGRYIQQVWELKKAPMAYIHDKDGGQYLQGFVEFGCQVVAQASGYSAVHFVISTKPNKQPYFVEIQLKTLFEEGWSEIDHAIRYPNYSGNELLNSLLLILNNLTTGADNMASYIRELTYTIEKQALDERHQQQHQEKELARFQAHISMLALEEAEKRRLYELLAKALQANHP